jgi:hypothetical protein
MLDCPICDSDLNKKIYIHIHIHIQINNGYSDSVHVINPNFHEFHYSLHFLARYDDVQTFYLVGGFFLCRFLPENFEISINDRVGPGD